jgi:hypothetical protein
MRLYSFMLFLSRAHWRCGFEHHWGIDVCQLASMLSYDGSGFAVDELNSVLQF